MLVNIKIVEAILLEDSFFLSNDDLKSLKPFLSNAVNIEFEQDKIIVGKCGITGRQGACHKLKSFERVK